MAQRLPKELAPQPRPAKQPARQRHPTRLIKLATVSGQAVDAVIPDSQCDEDQKLLKLRPGTRDALLSGKRTTSDRKDETRPMVVQCILGNEVTRQVVHMPSRLRLPVHDVDGHRRGFVGPD